MPDSLSTPHPPIIAVAIITAGSRPQGLRALLSSLVEQTGTGDQFKLNVTIVFNAAAADHKLPAEFPSLDISLEVEPIMGIPFARNRSILLGKKCGADYFAFIDDDEIAGVDWLSSALIALNEHGADGVAGYVGYEFSRPIPNWMSSGGFYDSPQMENGQEVDSARTGNLIVKASSVASLTWPPFDTALQFTGGSDIRFTKELTRNGTKIVWSNHCKTYELVPDYRCSPRWVIQRSFRVGNASGRDLIEANRFGALRAISGGLARGIYALLLILGGTVTSSGQRLGNGIRILSRSGGFITAPFYRYEEYRAK